MFCVSQQGVLLLVFSCGRDVRMLDCSGSAESVQTLRTEKLKIIEKYKLCIMYILLQFRNKD